VLKRIRIFLEMIKFSHTIFALPFALMGAFLAARGVPGAGKLAWILLAMVGARTCAMGFNRIVDRRFDALNPRTADRPLPAGTITPAQSWVIVLAAALLFFVACTNLNRLTLLLSPIALGLTFFYSFTKRFTWLSHLVLGLALACSPAGGYLAVAGSFDGFPFALALGVLFWVAGFDTIYACMDADFDRGAGLFSLPARFGRRNAFRLAVFFHGLAFAGFLATGVVAGLGFVYWIGLAVTAVALLHQHRLVSPTDLSRIRLSFFTMNGLISVVLFVATWLALVW
jgi:4-hydroxybenzoate polyprenyltransferase